MSFHAGQTFTFGETPSATKWNYLWENDYALQDWSAFTTASFPIGLLAANTPVQEVSVNYADVATGTTVIPVDNTIPQNTEGDEYMSLAITPKATTNILVIKVSIMLANSAAAPYVSAALFQDSTANALAAAVERAAVASDPCMISFSHRMAAGTTSATTFKVRAGGSAAGTTTLNGQAGNRFFGLITKSSIVITESKA